MISRRFKLAVGIGFAVGAGLVGGFAPVVRYEAGQAAARYGGTLSIEQVVPTWRGARLRGIDVALADVPSVKIHLDEVEVAFSAAGRKVDLRGGTIAALGPRERILHEAEAWRARHPPPASTGGAASSPLRTELAGLNVSWKNDAQAPTEALSASDVSFSRVDDKLAKAAQEVVTGQRIRVRRDQDEKLIEVVDPTLAKRVGAPAAQAPAADAVAPDGELHRAVLEVLAGGGGYFFRQLADAVRAVTGPGPEGDVADALWELVFAGLVSSDTLAPLRAQIGRASCRERVSSPV